jgi:hypothetical protein
VNVYLYGLTDVYPGWRIAAGYVDPGDYPAAVYSARPRSVNGLPSFPKHLDHSAAAGIDCRHLGRGRGADCCVVRCPGHGSLAEGFADVRDRLATVDDPSGGLRVPAC